MFTFCLTLTPLVISENKIVPSVGLIFSRKGSLYKRELLQKCLLRRDFSPPPWVKFKKNSPKINEALNKMKLIFLEVVHQALYSEKVWGNRFFLFCIRLVGPYSKPFLNIQYLFAYMPNRKQANSELPVASFSNRG